MPVAALSLSYLTADVLLVPLYLSDLTGTWTLEFEYQTGLAPRQPLNCLGGEGS